MNAEICVNTKLRGWSSCSKALRNEFSFVTSIARQFKSIAEQKYNQLYELSFGKLKTSMSSYACCLDTTISYIENIPRSLRKLTTVVMYGPETFSQLSSIFSHSPYLQLNELTVAKDYTTFGHISI